MVRKEMFFFAYMRRSASESCKKIPLLQIRVVSFGRTFANMQSKRTAYVQKKLYLDS